MIDIVDEMNASFSKGPLACTSATHWRSFATVFRHVVINRRHGGVPTLNDGQTSHPLASSVALPL